MADQESDQLLFCFRPPCPVCGSGVSDYDVSVHSAKQREDDSWEVHGLGRVRMPCPTCGMMFEAISEAIPIECNGLMCPICGKSAELEYEIQRVDASGNEFKFLAIIRCADCRDNWKWRTRLKKLFAIKKIAINLDGITVEWRERSRR